MVPNRPITRSPFLDSLIWSAAALVLAGAEAGVAFGLASIAPKVGLAIAAVGILPPLVPCALAFRAAWGAPNFLARRPAQVVAAWAVLLSAGSMMAVAEQLAERML